MPYPQPPFDTNTPISCSQLAQAQCISNHSVSIVRDRKSSSHILILLIHSSSTTMLLYQQSQSKLIEVSPEVVAQSIPDLSGSFFDNNSDVEESCNTQRPSHVSMNSDNDIKSPSQNLKKKGSNGEIDLRGCQVGWRAQLDDKLDDASELESWYNGDEDEGKEISRNWVVIPVPKSEEEEMIIENDDRRALTLPFAPTLDASETWQILSRIPEKSVVELKKEEEDVRRYQWAILVKELMGIGMMGVEMFYQLTGRILGEVTRF